MAPTIQHRKMTYLPEDLNTTWTRYKRQHPEQSYNGLVVVLLRDYLESVTDSAPAREARETVPART